jgi:hypothetical protein
MQPTASASGIRTATLRPNSRTAFIGPSDYTGIPQINFGATEAPTGEHQMRLHNTATGDTGGKTILVGTT